MEQIIIVDDDTDDENTTPADNDFDNEYKKQLDGITDFLCKIYGLNSSDISDLVNNRVNNSVSARYIITAITTLRSNTAINDIYSSATTESEIADALAKAIINMYAARDDMNEKVIKATESVKQIKEANDTIKNMFETEIKAAFDREKQATNALIEQYKVSLEAKDKTYTLIMRNNNDIKKENNELKEQLDVLQVKNDELKAMLSLKTKNKADKTSDISCTDKKSSSGKGWIKFFRNENKDKMSYVLDIFISDILSSDDFSKEQKNFLMNCIESRMPYKEIKKIAKPELDVDMMRRIVKYYNRNMDI